MFSSHIEQREKWLWATRPDISGAMYFFEREPIEALVGKAPDYWAASFAGHGANSYSMNFFVVEGPIALFLQEGWGGAYMDEAKQRRMIEEELAAAARLLDSARSRSRQGLFPPRAHLVVAASGFRGNRWECVPLPMTEDAARSWLARGEAGFSGEIGDATVDNASETLREATDWVESLPSVPA